MLQVRFCTSTNSCSTANPTHLTRLLQDRSQRLKVRMLVQLRSEARTAYTITMNSLSTQPTTINWLPSHQDKDGNMETSKASKINQDTPINHQYYLRQPRSSTTTTSLSMLQLQVKWISNYHSSAVQIKMHSLKFWNQIKFHNYYIQIQRWKIGKYMRFLNKGNQINNLRVIAWKLHHLRSWTKNMKNGIQNNNNMKWSGSR